MKINLLFYHFAKVGLKQLTIVLIIHSNMPNNILNIVLTLIEDNNSNLH